MATYDITSSSFNIANISIDDVLNRIDGGKAKDIVLLGIKKK